MVMTMTTGDREPIMVRGAAGDHESRRPSCSRKALKVVSVSKRFYGVQALLDVSLDLEAGEVLGLVGENGAGKSTLIKILAGAIQADEGQLLVWGSPYSPKSPADAWRYGIAIIYQDRQLMPSSRLSEHFLTPIAGSKGDGVTVANRQEVAEEEGRGAARITGGRHRSGCSRRAS